MRCVKLGISVEFKFRYGDSVGKENPSILQCTPIRPYKLPFGILNERNGGRDNTLYITLR